MVHTLWASRWGLRVEKVTLMPTFGVCCIPCHFSSMLQVFGTDNQPIKLSKVWNELNNIILVRYDLLSSSDTPTFTSCFTSLCGVVPSIYGIGNTLLWKGNASGLIWNLRGMVSLSFRVKQKSSWNFNFRSMMALYWLSLRCWIIFCKPAFSDFASRV